MPETDSKKAMTMASGVTPQPLDEETSAEMARLNPHVGSNLPMCVSRGWCFLPISAGRQRQRERERERATRDRRGGRAVAESGSCCVFGATGTRQCRGPGS
eukprot:COSAG02_NODE_2039_length_10034_cov_3.282536_2_plen_101_part_00